MSRFPAAFQPPAFASRSPCSRPGPGPSSRSAYRVPPRRPDPDGVSTFHTCEIRPGRVPPLPRGRRCSSRPDAVPGRRLPFPSAQSLHPAPASHQRGSSITGHQRGSRDSPVRSAPHLWPPGWDGRPLGFPLCSAPRRYRRRTTGRGRAASTRPKLRDRHSRPSNPRVHSHSATSCRNGQMRMSDNGSDELTFRERRCNDYIGADRP